MPYVQYWSIGNQAQTSLSLTQAEIADALVADWLPSFPVAASRSILGWPHFLIEIDSINSYLALKSMTGWSDRQWKGVLSWMLGVAGTRKILGEEGYIWIAPSSAFYPERKKPVLTPFWHPNYPPSVLEIALDPSSGSRLRPDYIAARYSQQSHIEFALVESKGTSSCLRQKHSCPVDWARQVRITRRLRGRIFNCQFSE